MPTSRPAIGSAQYSKVLTLPKPNDDRLEVMRIAARLSVNVTGLGTATHVYCSVRVDVDDADHKLFSEDWTSTGAKLDGVNTDSTNKATIFNSLKNGAAHTFYFLFWADAANQASIDVVELWLGIGSCSTTWGRALRAYHRGLAFIGTSGPVLLGSGTKSSAMNTRPDESGYYSENLDSAFGQKLVLLDGWHYLWAKSTLVYFRIIDMNLQSLQ